MARYPALIDGENGAYGVTFPDLPGIVAMGATLDEALSNAEEALSDASAEAERDGEPLESASAIEEVEVPAGSALATVPLIRPSPKRIRANLTLSEGVVEFMDHEARRRGMTRTAFVEWMARRIARAGG